MNNPDEKSTLRIRTTRKHINGWKEFVAKGGFSNYDEALRWVLAQCPLPSYR
jgi:hypothetical protein